MLFCRISGLCVALGLAAAASGFTADGLIGDLGSAYGTDPVLPSAGEGGASGTDFLDLAGVYVAESGGTIDAALTVHGTLATSNNTAYALFIRTDNGGAGCSGNSDARGAAVSFANFQPQYELFFEFSSTGPFGGSVKYRIYHWNSSTSAWENVPNSPAILFTAGFSANGNGGDGGVEWSLNRVGLGSPSTIQVVGAAAPFGQAYQDFVSDTAQPNGADSSTAVAPAAPSAAATVPVTVSGFTLE